MSIHSHAFSDKEAVLLSQHKHAFAEQELEGYEAVKAVDGQADTCWQGGEYYKWWSVDLGDVYPLREIHIDASANDGRYVHYFVEASSDALNWSEVASKMNDDLATEAGVQHPVAVEARYVRVTVTYCSTAPSACLRHVAVYGRNEPVNPVKDLPRSASMLFLASVWDETQGFIAWKDNEVAPGQNVVVAASAQPGSYLLYRDVDFTKAGIDQITGAFGFSNLDKSLKATVEVRLGGVHGTVIGELILFKQWKRWSGLAGDLRLPGKEKLTGRHDVALVLTAIDGDQTLMIYWLSFTQASTLPAPTPRTPDLPEPQGEYAIYFGNLHSHTAFSDGIGVPEDAYDYARYTGELDFLAITEHSNLYDHDLAWDRSRKWKEIKAVAAAKTEEGAFLALYGAETTWYNQFGHMNTYNLDFFINTYETKYNDIPTYYELAKRYPDSIHQWNHPWSCGNRHLDGFSPYDAELDKVMHMVEINTIESKELGGLYYYVRALDLGWHIAPVGSQDNHHGQWGTANTLRTGVLVDRLTEADFFDAVRRQRVYFTSALFLQIWFRINGAIMGSRLPQTEELTFEIKASYRQDTQHQIIRVEIIGEQGRVLHSQDCAKNELNIHMKMPAGERYYFVKVYQDDEEFAATAPIWVG